MTHIPSNEIAAKCRHAFEVWKKHGAKDSGWLDAANEIERLQQRVAELEAERSQSSTWLEFAQAKQRVAELERELQTQATEMQADYEELKASHEPHWQPIETAPKDGRRLLLARFGWANDPGEADPNSEEWRKNIWDNSRRVYGLWWATTGHWSRRWNNWNDSIEQELRATRQFATRNRNDATCGFSTSKSAILILRLASS